LRFFGVLVQGLIEDPYGIFSGGGRALRNLPRARGKRVPFIGD
jgi:hypothetical protein